MIIDFFFFNEYHLNSLYSDIFRLKNITKTKRNDIKPTTHFQRWCCAFYCRKKRIEYKKKNNVTIFIDILRISSNCAIVFICYDTIRSETSHVALIYSIFCWLQCAYTVKLDLYTFVM